MSLMDQTEIFQWDQRRQQFTKINYRVTAMGMWRNGSASDFDCHSLSEGCSFEYCHAHFFSPLSLGGDI